MEVTDPSFWQHKRVFVTGGTGFIGTHLVKKLDELGAYVKLFVHNKLPADRGLIGIKGDLTESNGELKNFLEGFKPEIVFHLAAQPIVNMALDNHLPTLKVNIDGTFNLLSACYHLRWLENFVHISTDKVYGDVPVIRKDTIANSTTHPYNTSKLSADLLAQMYGETFGTPITVIRNGNVYGTGDVHWDRLIPGSIIRVLSGSRPVARGSGKPLRDYIYVSEVVTGYLNAARKGVNTKKPLILNLGSKSPYSVIDVIDTILKVAQRIDLAPVLQPLVKGEIPDQHIEDDTALKLIGWDPEIDLEEGIRQCWNWYSSIPVEKEND